MSPVQAPPLSQPVAVSFAVIAFNEEANIEACLRSVLAQRGAQLLEVVVVDDGSTDRTADIVRRLSEADPRVRLLQLPANRGRGNARALVTQQVRADLVAMVDGDVVLPAGWLQTCLSGLGDHSVVGGQAVPDGDVTFVYRIFRLTPRGRPSTMTITGNNGLYRREVFQRVGFDPALVEGEDIAFNHALRAGGFSAATVPGLTVLHRETKGFWESLGWFYLSGKGASRQLEKYRQLRLPDVAFLGLVCSVGAGAGLVLRSGRRYGWWLAPLWQLTVATGHMAVCFRPSRSDLGRFVLGCVVDALMICAYDVGRAVGHARLRAPSPTPAAPSGLRL
jgi:glycosyltransferase involved in cell wall biosynthesis